MSKKRSKSRRSEGTTSAGGKRDDQDTRLTENLRSGDYVEPTAAELAGAADELQRIGVLIKQTGGRLTLQLRNIISDTLSRAHLRPASLAMLYTRYSRGVRNNEHEHRLRVALELLGQLMVKKVQRDHCAAAKVCSIAETILATAESLRPPVPQDQWLTVTDAAKLLIKDSNRGTLNAARARVSWAAGENKFGTNEKKGLKRRIDPVSFNAWRLEQRDRDLAKEDDRD